MIPTGPGFVLIKKPPVLNAKKLREYCDAELALFKQNLHEILKPMVGNSCGRPFAMIMHDVVTLSNKAKFNSIGIQFIDPHWDSNHVVALGFGKIMTSATASLAEQLKEIVQEITRFPFEKVIA